MKLKWTDAEREAERLIFYLGSNRHSLGIKKDEVAAALMAVARDEWENAVRTLAPAVVPRPLS